MLDVILILAGAALGASLAHASALKEMKLSIETDFAAIREHIEELKAKL